MAPKIKEVTYLETKVAQIKHCLIKLCIIIQNWEKIHSNAHQMLLTFH